MALAQDHEVVQATSHDDCADEPLGHRVTQFRGSSPGSARSPPGRRAPVEVEERENRDKRELLQLIAKAYPQWTSGRALTTDMPPS